MFCFLFIMIVNLIIVNVSKYVEKIVLVILLMNYMVKKLSVIVKALKYLQ